MHHCADTVDAFPRILRFSIPDPPVQPLHLLDDYRLRGRARRITRRQSIANLFEMLKPHRDMEPVQNRRFQDASTGENTPESRTTIGDQGLVAISEAAGTFGIDDPREALDAMLDGVLAGVDQLTA